MTSRDRPPQAARSGWQPRTSICTLTVHERETSLPLLGLRVAADDFFEQIEEALRSRGFPAPRRTA
jgi:hypothetical protein